MRRQKLDNFREWVSDNLRYIMLICAIAIVLIGLFFGVRAITGRKSSGSTGAGSENDSVITNVIPAEEIESGVAMAESQETLKENNNPEITGLVTTYYMALNSKNVESVRAISDKLSDQDVKDIENSETEYSDIKAYVKPGPENDDSSYVVYASYQYINPSLYVKHPGLSWLFVKRDDKGDYRIVVDAASDEKVAEYVNKLSSGADVKALVEEITKASEQAELEEQAAAEAAGTASSEPAKEMPAPAAEETAAPAESTESPEKTDAAPAEEAAAQDNGEEEDEEEEDEGPSYNNTFPNDGASEHSASIGSTCNLREGAGYNYKVITVL